jgi:hypothetical protein
MHPALSQYLSLVDIFSTERCWFPPLRAMDHPPGQRVEEALEIEELRECQN